MIFSFYLAVTVPHTDAASSLLDLIYPIMMSVIFASIELFARSLAAGLSRPCLSRSAKVDELIAIWLFLVVKEELQSLPVASVVTFRQRWRRVFLKVVCHIQSSFRQFSDGFS